MVATAELRVRLLIIRTVVQAIKLIPLRKGACLGEWLGECLMNGGMHEGCMLGEWWVNCG